VVVAAVVRAVAAGAATAVIVAGLDLMGPATVVAGLHAAGALAHAAATVAGLNLVAPATVVAVARVVAAAVVTRLGLAAAPPAAVVAAAAVPVLRAGGYPRAGIGRGRGGRGGAGLSPGAHGDDGEGGQCGQDAGDGDACAIQDHAAEDGRRAPKRPRSPGQTLAKPRRDGCGGGYARSPMATRILIVEDERSIAEPFARLLRREGFETILAETAAEALDAARTTEPDLVLLDLALPDGDGRDICRVLRAERDVPVIMVTARGTETDRVVGLELGADDYVVKPFSAAEVIARIRAVLRRSARAAAPAAPAAPIRVDGLEVDVAARRVVLEGSELELSRKEFDLLAELVRHAGRVVTREDLMSRVWDENWFGSTKTLDVHMGWLRRKLGDEAADPRFIHTVRGVGFRFTAPDEEA
jgi:two-component system, OmpR family, response regulator RegX3